MRRHCGLALLAAAVLALAGCATAVSDADRAFEAGEYALAASLYPARLPAAAPGLDERSQFRAALACALAAPPVGDRRVAARGFEELLRRYPGSPFRGQAELCLELLRREETLESELEALTRDLGAGEAKERVLLAQSRSRELELERARALLREAEARLRRLEEELAAMKRIDLERGR